MSEAERELIMSQRWEWACRLGLAGFCLVCVVLIMILVL